MFLPVKGPCLESVTHSINFIEGGHNYSARLTSAWISSKDK